MKTTTYQVENVSCGHCTGSIERELGEIEGVESVSASLDGRVEVQHEDEIDPSAIRALLSEINYPARDVTG